MEEPKKRVKYREKFEAMYKYLNHDSDAVNWKDKGIKDDAPDYIKQYYEDCLRAKENQIKRGYHGD